MVGCTIHLETIKEYFQEKGKKDCRVIKENAPVRRLWIPWMVGRNVDNIIKLWFYLSLIPKNTKSVIPVK